MGKELSIAVGFPYIPADAIGQPIKFVLLSKGYISGIPIAF